MYSVEVLGSEAFDASLLEIICIKCPITEQEHIVELRYDGRKMKGGTEGLSYNGEPVSQTQMLSMSKEYADALGLAESKRFVNILAFDDFIKKENRKDGKQHKVSEDYIHSFIAEHERDYEPEEEYDCIISNPPFSLKDDIIKRLWELDKPYAMLLPIPALQGQKRFPYMKDCQALLFDKRINYFTTPERKEIQKGVSFGSFYLCRNFLPKDLIFEELNTK
jgi:hypothetical protein